jgi:hypothetical protein
MKRLEDFRIFYNHTIYPELQRMEKRRNRLILLLVVSASLCIVLFIIAQLLHIFSLSLLIILIEIFYALFLVQKIKNYIQTFKPRVMNLILDFIDDSINYGTLKYDANGGLDKKTFLSSNIFTPRSVSYTSEDYIGGNIGSIAFELSETRVTEFSRVKNMQDWVFDGVFMKAKLQIPVKGSLLIIPKTEKPYLSRTIKKWMSSGHVKVNNLIRNKTFRNRFETFANKKSNPMQFLTEGLQTSILQYIDQHDKLFYLSYKNGTIYLAVSEEKDILEPNIFKSNLKFTLIKEFYEDVYILLQILEDLDLHH